MLLLDRVRRGWEYLRCRGETLLPCRFSVLVLAVVALAFLVSDQGSETLRVVAEFTARDARAVEQVGLRYPFRVAIFLLAVAGFATQLWYCSRQALSFEVPSAPPPGEIRRLVQWAPRVLGALGFLIPAAGLVAAGRASPDTQTAKIELALAGALVVGCALFLWAVVRRRRRIRRKTREDIFEKRIRTVRELPAGAIRVVVVTIFVGLSLFVVVIVAPVRFSQAIGAPAVLLLCAGIWVWIGAVLLYLAGSWRLPVVTGFLLFAILVSRWTDNHVVEALPGGGTLQRVSLVQALRDRRDALDGAYGRVDHPIYVVAAEGGGIRAAYWTAAVLAALQDANQAFAPHCFAISGVSGGSLGAAVFTTLLRTGSTSYRECAHDILSADFLSPTLARMFGTDLPKQFLPFVPLPDRGRGLEMAWEDAWSGLKPGVFGEPFLGAEGDPSRPILFLNGTWAETGRRIIFSAVRIDGQFENAVDGFDRVGGDLRVSTAVHMSARFTYVSPAATVLSRQPGQSLHVVDGGYFEDSGAATASDVWAAIEEAHLERISPRVLLIRFRDAATSPVPQEERFRGFLSESLSPIRAMLGARTSRGRFAVEELQKRSRDRWIEFVLTPDEAVPLPLGWLLSAASRDSIDTALLKPEIAGGIRRVNEELRESTGSSGRTGADPVAANAEFSKAARRTNLLQHAFQGR